MLAALAKAGPIAFALAGMPLVARAQGSAERPGRADAVVAADGSGDFKTVQEAVNAAPQTTSATHPWVVFVKAGTYRELVYVQREKRFLALVGEDPARTVLTYNLSAGNLGLDGKAIGTFRTPSVQIDADDFTAENLTFENSAGPVGQALAVRVDGDRVVFRNCRFLGWQDTIFLNRGRHYFEDCLIAGHVDFIFGGATAFFERCHLHCWRNGYITAASTPAQNRHGFVFANGTISGESPAVKTYLGRPWRDFAQVAFLKTEMSEVVRPEGWDNWGRPEREKTTRYGELGSTGVGANPAPRVAWARRLSAEEAAAMAPEKVLSGSDGWDPRTTAPRPSPTRATALPLPLAPGFTLERVLADLRRDYPQVSRVADELPAGVAARQGIVYARRGDRELQLDVYRPDGPGPFPGVVIVHGGGWEAGDREMERPFAKQLAARGYVTVPVSYRLGPDGRFPGAVHDLKEAVRWLRAHAAEHGIDPARIGVVGASAGGHLAAFLGATNGLDRFEGEGGSVAPESRVQAVVDIDGAAGFVDPALIDQEAKARGATSRFLGGSYGERAAVWQEASPLAHVGAHSAPTLFMKSSASRPILPGREEMAAKLKGLGIDAAVVSLPDTPHPFWLVHPWFERVLEEVDRFLGQHLRPEPAGRP